MGRVTESAEAKILDWIKRLNSETLPVFSDTSRAVASSCMNDEPSSVELAEIILRDIPMTARVLRAANSVHYNPAGTRITTVSYATVVLGWKTVRNLALSSALIDSILNNATHEQAVGELALSLHAATQAKMFSTLIAEEDPEEVFIGALLKRLGNVLYWCFPYGTEAALTNAYAQGETAEVAESQVLGFTLMKLTRALVQHWNLSTLLEKYISSDDNPKSRSQPLDLAINIAEEMRHSWNSNALYKHISDLAELLGQPEDEVHKLVFLNVQSAMQSMRELGIEYRCDSNHQNTLNESFEDATPVASYVLDLFRELITQLSEKRHINILLSTIIEGIYRGLQMDSVLLAMVGPGNGRLQVKCVLGTDKDLLMRDIRFNDENDDTNVFLQMLKKKQPVWYAKNGTQYQGVTKDDESQIQPCFESERDFFCQTITLKGKAVGIIYADRYLQEGAFTEEEFLTFKHISEHASIAMSML